jgi:glycosyltransferase A (GT-A) superfamily protein (DUF2064 family)
MLDYFQTAFARGYQQVVLIGSDLPQLPRSVINEAFAALEQVPLVLGPTEDGGYYLIGMRDEPLDVFQDVPWSTREVWQATLHQITLKSIPFHTLPSDYDIDTHAELQRLLDDQRVDIDLRKKIETLVHG